MKKKTKTKKLTLARETVRRLAHPELRQVAGAIHTDDCMTGNCPTAETPCDPVTFVCPTTDEC
jgi:hypothetical protein